MLTPSTIVRLAMQERYGQLLDALIANGQHLAPALRPGLTVSPVPALAIGIKRIVELDRKPWPTCDPLLQALLAHQKEDGSFGDPLSTAMAAAALGNLLRQPGMEETHIASAHQQVLTALAAQQLPDQGWQLPTGSPIHSSHHRLVNAFILQLLARDSQARQLLALDQLLARLEQHPASQNPETQSSLRIARACMLRPVAA